MVACKSVVAGTSSLAFWSEKMDAVCSPFLSTVAITWGEQQWGGGEEGPRRAERMHAEWGECHDRDLA